MTAAVPGPAAPDALAAAPAPDLVAVIGYLTAPEPARRRSTAAGRLLESLASAAV